MGYVKFLGTAGARFVVARQLRYSAGTWIELSEVRILLDPGPGTLLRCRRARPPLDPAKLSAVALSHKHLDHSTDVNIVVEAMADGGRRARGVLLAPGDALEGEDPVVLRYVRPFVQRVEQLGGGREISVDGVEVRPVRHVHGEVETYGLVFSGEEGQLGFVVDGKYQPGLAESYAGCDLLVINTVRKEWSPDVDHLSLPEAVELARAVQPKLTVLTHFGMTMLRANPRVLAAQVSEQIGLPVIAATDGLTVAADRWG
ncbi:MAG: MBL fold metallo-hydrolase [Candidatus Bipolaricaulaceae bacterium]